MSLPDEYKPLTVRQLAGMQQSIGRNRRRLQEVDAHDAESHFVLCMVNDAARHLREAGFCLHSAEVALRNGGVIPRSHDCTVDECSLGNSDVS